MHEALEIPSPSYKQGTKHRTVIAERKERGGGVGGETWLEEINVCWVPALAKYYLLSLKNIAIWIAHMQNWGFYTYFEMDVNVNNWQVGIYAVYGNSGSS